MNAFERGEVALKPIEARECHKSLLEDAQAELKASRNFDLRKAKGGDVIPDEWIVVLKPGENPDKVLKDLGFSHHDIKSHAVDNDRHLRVYKHALKGFSCRLTKEEKARLDSDSRIKFIEQDKVIKLDPKEEIHRIPLLDDEQPKQEIPSGILRMGIRSCKVAAIGKHQQVKANIAIVDTGIELTHPDLNVTHDVTFVEKTTSGNDDQGHGTGVAGPAAAKDNDIGVVGVAPGASLWAVKVVDATGSGRLSDVIAGVDYITKHNKEIDVANLSLGMKGKSQALEEAINKSVESGVTYVVAAGNEHEATSNWTPANIRNVITVTAVAITSEQRYKGPDQTCAYDKADRFIADMSNHDPKIEDPEHPVGVEAAAAGSCVYTTAMGSSYGTMSGTSIAAPHVTGAVADWIVYQREQKKLSIFGHKFSRIFSHKEAQSMALQPLEARNAIVSHGKHQDDKDCGFDGDPDNMHEPMCYVGDW